MKNQLSELLNKRMNRKDFLKHLGLGLAVMFGLGGVLRLFANTPSNQQKRSSYGSSTYGG